MDKLSSTYVNRCSRPSPVIRIVFCSFRFADIRTRTGRRRPAPRHDESCSTSCLRIYCAHYFRGARVPAKKAVNVSVPAELLAAARAEDINLSAALETALAEQLRIRRREKWLAESARAIAAYNREIDEHGAFGDKVRSF